MDVECLKFTTSQHLDKIVPKELFGPRILFEYNLKRWQQSLGVDCENSEPSISISELSTVNKVPHLDEVSAYICDQYLV